MTEQELVRRFHQALTDISTLAEAIGELHWKRAFFDKANLNCNKNSAF